MKERISVGVRWRYFRHSVILWHERSLDRGLTNQKGGQRRTEQQQPPTTLPLPVGIMVACIIPQLAAGFINFQEGEILIGTLNGVFGMVATIGISLTTWMLITSPKPGAITP